MFEKIISNISAIVVGNSEKIKLTLAAIVSEGSILIEDYPDQARQLLRRLLQKA